MKKSFILLSAALASLLAFTGCESGAGTETKGEELNPATLEVNPETVQLGKQSGSIGQAEITSDSETLSAIVDFPYRSWLSAEIEGNTLKVSALSANTASTTREGVVIVYAGEGINTVSKRINVVQDLENEVAPEISVDKSSVTLASSLNSIAVATVTTNMTEFTATVADDGKDWLSATIEGTVVTFKAIKENTATEGRSTTVELKVINGSKTATATVAVTQDAGGKGPAVGQVVDGGVLFWISEDGKSGKVVAPQRAEAAAAMFSVDRSAATGADGTHAAIEQEDGKANVAAMKTADPTLAKFPAAKFCDELDGGDWYLPAIKELLAIFKAYNGTSIDAATPNIPSGISAEEKAARKMFDQAILSLGGTVLNTQDEGSNGDSAFSSTEESPEKAYYVRFGKAICDKGNKDGKTRTARCIKTVNL